MIAINNAVYLAPWANILYFCDKRWLDWHRPVVDAFEGLRVTLENLTLKAEMPIFCLRDYGPEGMPTKNDGVTNGRNSGYQALQMAILLGAKRIFLLGFDMRAHNDKVHWHDEHPIPTPTNVFGAMIESFVKIAPILKQRGIEVINCTRESALKVFPYQSVERALCFAG